MEKEERANFKQAFKTQARALSLSKKVIGVCLEYDKRPDLIEKAEIEIAVARQNIDDILDDYLDT